MGGKAKTPAGKAEGETPQERKQRGGSPAARGKQSPARKPTAVSQAIHTSSFISFVRL
ncbi:hypothetical protein ABEX78_10825 [Priestia megaterium]